MVQVGTHRPLGLLGNYGRIGDIMPNFYQLEMLASERRKIDLFKAEQERLLTVSSLRPHLIIIWSRQLLVERGQLLQPFKAADTVNLVQE